MTVPLMQELHGFLSELSAIKQANFKRNGKRATEDPGSQDGDTTHPVADADNQTEKATEGAQSAANEKMVAETIPNTINEGTAATVPQEDLQNPLGTNKATTGKDPAAEKDIKGDKDDPGTASKMTTDDGTKFGMAQFQTLRKQASDLANEILASIAVSYSPGSPAPIPAPPPQTKAAMCEHEYGSNGKCTKCGMTKMGAAQPEPTAVQQAAATGYQAAEILANGYTPEQVKQAHYQQAVEQMIVEAIDAADLYINLEAECQKQAQVQQQQAYIQQQQTHAQQQAHAATVARLKRAADDEDSSSGGSTSEEKSEPPSNAGGGDAPPDTGGGGGEPMPPDMGGGAGGQEEALTQLLMALLQKGITPEELMKLLGGAGGGGGMPPDAGGGGLPPEAMAAMMGGAGGGGPPPGGPPPGAPPGGPPMEVAAADRRAQDLQRRMYKLAYNANQYFRSGKFKPREPKTAKEARVRQEISRYLEDIVRTR